MNPKTNELNVNDYPVLKPVSRLLLGPGPSMVPPQVLNAMSTPLLGHLDPDFLKLMDKIQELLRYVFETKNFLSIPISGTGSAAMETAIVNMIEQGDNALICVNGYFGNRIAIMAGRYGANVKIITRPWGEIFTAEEVKRALQDFPAQVVAIVQAETSTGVLQPIAEIAKIVHDQGGIIIVDAVTSLGGVPVRVDALDIDICYSASQKCLSSPPGLGPITLGSRALNRLKKRKTPVPSWYLDLSMVHQYWGQERTYHHTAPITANYALYESLRLVAEETLQARWNRHQENAEFLWGGLENIGLNCHVPLEYRLPTLTTIKVPKNINEIKVRKELLEKFNIEIAGGLGELQGKVWRVGLMGYSSRKENVHLFLEAIQQILNN